jgi:hypothetical protein
MTDRQWNDLLAVLRGEILNPLPVGFIVDCPWLPGWQGLDIADYLSSETLWFETNRKAIETFPDVWFLPGFWSEFGMCTEPSAFGSRCVFPRNEFPFAEKSSPAPDRSPLSRFPIQPRTVCCRSCSIACAGRARASKPLATKFASPSRAAR